jgi:site-specific DNA-adenine methylase
MWSYFGAKTNVIKRYPPPKYDKIIEPFAGSAQYALRYFDREVLLVDKYDVVVKIWKWLQLCSPSDILKLPRLKEGQKIEDIKFDCEEAKLLMGFMAGFSSTSPRNTATNKHTSRPNFVNFNLKKIAASLCKIKHWEVRVGSYEELENEEACWFIDPPYQFGGEHYVHGNEAINFVELGKWCMERKGQAIVCESSKANWLPFIPLVKQTTRGVPQYEVIWTNKFQYQYIPQQLF